MEKGLTIATLYALGDKISAKQKKKSSSSQEEEVVISDDAEGAMIILELTKEDVIKSNKQNFLRKGNKGHIYEVDESKNMDSTKNYFMEVITKNNLCVQRGKNIVPYSKNASGARNILSLLMPKFEKLDDITLKPTEEMFASKLWYSNLQKLCYSDGYYDFTDSTFKPYDENTFSTICIKKKFPLQRDEKVIQEIYDEVLNKTFQSKEQLNYFLNWTARCLAGHVEDKSWTMGLGNRNCGKGVLYTLFKSAFEDYVDAFNAEELLIFRVGNGDEAKKLGWTIPLQYKRLCFANEIKTEDMKGNKLKLDGAVIKRLTGGDYVQARLNYKDQISFMIQTHFVFFGNDMIEVSPSDALDTVNVFNFESEFVEQVELNEEQKQINATTSYKYYLAKRDLKTHFLKRRDVIDAFVHIILDHYSQTPLLKPNCVSNNLDDLLDSSNKEKQILLSIFKITRNENDKLPIEQFNGLIKGSLTKAKAKLLLKQLGVVEKVLKIERCNTRCYIGMVVKQE